MKSRNNPAREKAEAIYERYASKPAGFRLADVERAMCDGLREFANEAYDGWVRRLCREIDHARDEPESQQGVLFEMGGVYRLGDGKRIAKRLAQLHHAVEALNIDTANLKSVEKANERKALELERLRPYWGAGKTKAEAVEAWLKAHPTAAAG